MFDNNPKIDVWRDYRFSLEEQYENTVMLADKTAITHFHKKDGSLIGWELPGWKPPSSLIIYKCLCWWLYED